MTPNHDPQPLPGAPGSQLIRAYIWEVPVRVTHWLTFFSVVVLCITGYYIHNPFMTIRPTAPYTMAIMRFSHLMAGFVFTISFLWRVYWLFVGNGCARWRAFLPIRREQWRGMREMFYFYTFLRWRPRHAIGHNALAAAVYLFMFFLMLVQIVTGFALYGEVLRDSVVHSLFGWLTVLVDVQYLRLAHYWILFGFIAFTIHHVYSAILVSGEERNGLIESIFTGYKFVPAWDLEAQGFCAPEDRPKPPPAVTTPTVQEPGAS